MVKDFPISKVMKQSSLWIRIMYSTPSGPFGLDGYDLGTKSQTFIVRNDNAIEVIIDLNQLKEFQNSKLRYNVVTNNISEKCQELIEHDFKNRFGLTPVFNGSINNEARFLFGKDLLRKISIEYEWAIRNPDFSNLVQRSGDLRINDVVFGWESGASPNLN